MTSVHFPWLARRRKMNVLLGADYNPELMTMIKEVPGKANKPSARLCPLGWMAIRQINKDSKSSDYHTCNIYFTDIQKFRGNYLNKTLRKFWELEHIKILFSKQQFTPDEQEAWKKVSKLRIFEGIQYQVSVPRNKKMFLPPVINILLGKKHLHKVEWKLQM